MATRVLYDADLARVHHEGFGDIARAAGPAIVAALARAGIRRGLVVDLGCGSGLLARHLTDNGYSVLGIDASPAMLRIARRVAPRASFSLGRAEDVPIPPCAAIVATGEAITYLIGRRGPDALLRHHIRRAARALQPGGLFVFDAIVTGTPAMNYRTWRATDDWAVMVDVAEEVERRIVTRSHITFMRSAGGFRRSVGVHRAGVYDPRAVAGWLEAKGFTVAIRRRYGRFPLPPRRRLFIACR